MNQTEVLFKLIGEGHKRISDQIEERAILILGETGTGKSTLTYLFAGKDLKAVQGPKGDFVIDAKEKIEGVNISHKS